MKLLNRLKPYVIYFLLYAMIGWIYEEVLEVLIYQVGFSNRGVLFGPWLPVYGFGSLVFLITSYQIIKNKTGLKKWLWLPVVFLTCMLSSTLIELITSYICEAFMGSWPWDYTMYKINFEARIALNTSIRFGIGGVVFLYLLQPLFEKLVNKLGDKKVSIISIIILIVLAIDCIYSFFIK